VFAGRTIAASSVAALTVAALTCAAAVSGCDLLNEIGPEICRRPLSEDPVEFRGGEVVGRTYSTSPWDGGGVPLGGGGAAPASSDEGGAKPLSELLHFPGGAFYRIYHNLGVIPQGVQLYLSFSEYGVPIAGEDEGFGGYTGSIAPAAGNQAELKKISDTYIDVLNGSCVDYWLLAVVWADDAAEDE
jgi:hypothetical protein